jgi:hypothetical protein
MSDRHLQRDHAAVAETEEVRLGDVQMLEQRRSVLRRLHEAEWPVGDVRCMPEARLLERNDLAITRERRQQVAK